MRVDFLEVDFEIGMRLRKGARAKGDVVVGGCGWVGEEGGGV